MAIPSGHSPCAVATLAALAESGLATMGDDALGCSTGSLSRFPNVAGSESANSTNMTTETTTDTARSCDSAGVCSASVSDRRRLT